MFRYSRTENAEGKETKGNERKMPRSNPGYAYACSYDSTNASSSERGAVQKIQIVFNVSFGNENLRRRIQNCSNQIFLEHT